MECIFKFNFPAQNKWVCLLFICLYTWTRRFVKTHANNTTVKMQFVRNVVGHGPGDICFPSARYAVTLHIPTATEGFRALVSNGQNLYFIEGKLLFYEIFVYLWVYRLCVLLVVLVSRIGKGAISKWFPLQTIDEVRSCSFSSNLTVQVIYENNVTILSWLVYRKRGILDQNKYFFYAFLGEKSVFVLSLFALADMSL